MRTTESAAAAALGSQGRQLFSRSTLLVDLEHAARPGTEPTVLVIAHLPDLRQLLTTLPAQAAELLLARLTQRLSDEFGPSARSYESRRDQFLFLLPAADAELRLERAGAGIAEAADPYRLEVAFGTALLPNEASTPVEALECADERLFVAVLNERDQGRASGREHWAGGALDRLARTVGSI